MDLTYLIIPIGLFLVLVLVRWLGAGVFPVGNQTVTRKGRLADISRIVSVLMTAKRGERRATLSIDRRVTSLVATFSDLGVELKLPLSTRSQIKRKYDLLAIFAGACHEARLQSDGDMECIQATLTGTPQVVTSELKRLFKQVFAVGDHRTLRFEVSADVTDLNAMRFWLPEDRYEETKLDAFPQASTAGVNPEGEPDSRVGCLSAAAYLLLWPVPFLLTYMWYGVEWASAVGMLSIVIWLAYRFLKDHTLPKSFVGRMNHLLAFCGYGLTIYLADPIFLQWVPTLLCGLVLITNAGAFVRGRSIIDILHDEPILKTLSERAAITLAVCLVCAAGMWANEYLRAYATLDGWIWYYSYFRLELLLGGIFTIGPTMAWISWKQVQAEEEEQS